MVGGICLSNTEYQDRLHQAVERLPAETIQRIAQQAYDDLNLQLQNDKEANRNLFYQQICLAQNYNLDREKVRDLVQKVLEQTPEDPDQYNLYKVACVAQKYGFGRGKVLELVQKILSPDYSEQLKLILAPDYYLLEKLVDNLQVPLEMIRPHILTAFRKISPSYSDEADKMLQRGWLSHEQAQEIVTDEYKRNLHDGHFDYALQLRMGYGPFLESQPESIDDLLLILDILPKTEICLNRDLPEDPF